MYTINPKIGILKQKLVRQANKNKTFNYGLLYPYILNTEPILTKHHLNEVVSPAK